MAQTVGQHGLAAFTAPSNGDALDATVVKGNDNTVRNAYVDHDSDPGIHVQSSLLAARPFAGEAGRKWITTDSGSVKLWFDNGSTWDEVSAQGPAAAGTLTGTTLASNVVTSSLTALGTITTGVWNGTAITDAYLGTISTAGRVANSATTATAASTGTTIALRNASGQTAVKALLVDGTSSGTVTVQGAAAAGTWTLTLPTTAGSANQVLTTNGSGVTSWGSPPQPLDEQTFNSSGTWTKPSVGSMALIEVWASGGGGSNSTTTGASGGAGGNYMFRIVPLNALSATASITVGAGGAGAAASTNNNGGAGNQSSFSGTVTVTSPGSQAAQNNFTACPNPYVNNGGGVALFQMNSGAGSISSAQVAQMAIVDGKFSGGYGGSGSFTAITSSSVYGGGGGAAQGGAAAGISVYGGNGGAVGANGTAPGGGGGSGNNTTAAGSGAAGRVKVTVW